MEPLGGVVDMWSAMPGPRAAQILDCCGLSSMSVESLL